MSDFQSQLKIVRPVTRDLINALLFDAWPGNAAVIDFGLESQQHYEALYYPIRAGEILPQALDDALGDGERLTALVQSARHNPHKDVQFYTSYDSMAGKPRPPGALSEETKLEKTLNRLIGKRDTGRSR
jgi:hypothetical protein